MTALTETPVLTEMTEQRTLWVPPRPLTFDEYLDLFGPKDDAVQLDHERLFSFLFRLLGDYAEGNALGLVLGSRTPVQISQFRGRMPDLLFIRQDRLDTLDQRVVREAPDLIIEIVSPNDRPSHLIALETDYRAIGVSEVVFIDRQRQIVRVLRKGDGDAYAETSLGLGETVRLETMQGIALSIGWLLTETRPAVPDTLVLLNSAG